MTPPKFVYNKHFIVCLTLLLIGITFYIFVVDCSQRTLLDFEVYTEAAKAFQSGDNIYAAPYTVTDRWGRQVSLYYLYPPFLAQGLSKFQSFAPATLKFAWCLLSFICTLGSAYCIAQLVRFSWWRKFNATQLFLITYFFVVCFEPVYWGFSDGQVSAIILLLLSIFLLAGLRGNETISGVALALAVLVKMSPIILILALARFRRWRAMAAFGATCALVIALTWLDTQSMQIFSDFFLSLLSIADDRASRGFLFNFVFDKSLLVAFGYENSEIARCIVRALLIAVPVLAVLKIRGRSREEELRLDAILICCMLACSPIIWFHHLCWALLPLAILSCSDCEKAQQHLKSLTICVGLYFALSQVNLIHYWTIKEFADLTWVSSLLPVALLLILAALNWKAAQAPPKIKNAC